MTPRHRRLQGQLDAHFGPDGPPPELGPFLDAVDQAYRRDDAERCQLARSLELSAGDLTHVGAEMRALLRAFPDLFFTLARDGTILSCHDGGERGRYGGRAAHDLVGLRLPEVPAAEARGCLDAALARVCGGSPLEVVDYALPSEEGEHHYEARLVGLNGDKVLCVVRNDTDLQRAQRRLLEYNSLLQAALEGTADGLLVVDLNGIVVDFNVRCVQMWGVPEHLVRLHLEHGPLAFDLSQVPEGAADGRPTLISLVADLKDPARFMLRLRAGRANPGLPLREEIEFKDGRVFDVCSTPYWIMGRIEGRVWSFRDITMRRRLEEQYRHAQRMEAVGRLAGGVAHDFNNLLTAITGYSELLLKSLHDRPDDRQKADEVHRAAVRAASLTRQLLAFSRKQVLEPRVIDLGDVVEGMQPMLTRLLGEHIHLRVARAPGLGRVKADPGQVEQVIMNLAINARDAMPRGGMLTFELANAAPGGHEPTPHACAPPSAWVRLLVRDTGCGMDEATRVRVFEPFFTTKEAGQGTGLGLSTVYGIVEQSGGTIEVDSVPGCGSVFRIDLPRVPEPADAAGADAADADAARGGETVLVVEDEELVRALECEVLAQRGYRVLAAGCAREALEIEREEGGPIHLLVTDIVMPGASGRELAERMGERRPDTRVLYVSGYAGDPAHDGGPLEEGARFLQKPFSPDVFARVVRDTMDARPAATG